MAKELRVGGKLVEDAVVELKTLQADLPKGTKIDVPTIETMQNNIIEDMLTPLLVVKATGRTVGQMIDIQRIAKKVRDLKDGATSVILDEADYKLVKTEFEAFGWPINQYQQVAVFAAHKAISAASEPLPVKEEKQEKES